jgi:anti-sigma B factor antagonist
VVGLAAGRGPGVVALLRRIFGGLTGGVLVAVAGVLDQLAFGFFEALGFAAAALHDRARGFVRLFLGGRLRAGTSADRCGLGGGRLGLFSGWIRSWHVGFLTRPLSRQTIAGGKGTPSMGQRRSVGSRTVQSHFRLEVRNQGRATVIAVSGELDLASSPALQEELDRVAVSDSQMLIIDLRELDFMDSTGLSVLVRAHQRIEEQGRQLAMVKGPQQVQRLLSLTGVAERLTLVDTPEELLGQD